MRRQTDPSFPVELKNVITLYLDRLQHLIDQQGVFISQRAFFMGLEYHLSKEQQCQLKQTRIFLRPNRAWQLFTFSEVFLGSMQDLQLQHLFLSTFVKLYFERPCRKRPAERDGENESGSPCFVAQDEGSSEFSRQRFFRFGTLDTNRLQATAHEGQVPVSANASL